MKKRLALAALIMGLTAPSASLAVTSTVPLIAEVDLVGEIRMLGGRFCIADPTFGGDGSVEAVALRDCVIARFENGRLELAREGAPEERTVLLVARAPRGALLLQSRQPGGLYRVEAAKISDNGIAFLPTPPLGLEAFTQSDRPNGPLLTLQRQVGRWFDQGLRDEALGRRLLDEPTFLVRVEAGASPEAPKAAVERLRSFILRAMTLE